MTEEPNPTRGRRRLRALLSRTVVTALLVLAGVAGVTVVTAAPAFAGNGFYPCGSPCDHWDPNSVVTLARTSGSVALLYCTSDEMDARSTSIVILRYSPACETTWGHVNPYCNCIVSNVWIESYRTSTTTTLRASDGALPENTEATYMLNDSKLYNRACATWSGDWGTTWQTSCTSRY